MFEGLINWLKNRGISNTLIAFFLFLFFLQLGVIVHESSHVLVARVLGCEAGVHEANFFTGVSGVSCDMFQGAEKNNRLVIIALAGPLIAFLFGCLLWYTGKDAIERMGAIEFWLYSTLPSLYPYMPMSDMAQAISFGLRPGVGWLIFIAVTMFIAYQIAVEVTEKSRPFV